MLGARGAVGTVVRRELEDAGHEVTAASRASSGGARVDLHADLSPIATLAAAHDVVVNASGVERAELASATRATPLVDISATGSYLERLRSSSMGPVVLGAGLAPGLSTILARAVAEETDAGDLDVLVMLGAGEKHGPAAVDWTAGLVGTPVHRPPEGGDVQNLRESLRAAGPDGRARRYLRADFPDHMLLDDLDRPVRSWLTLGSAPLTAALSLVGRMPALRGMLNAAPHWGSDAWHVVVRDRGTGRQRSAEGRGQSEATGRLTALAVVRVAERASSSRTRAVTMADLVTAEEALAVLSR
ncbi:hypothetical protein [Microbacterium sp. NPDC089695]|uniref:hypothetical protein n=1 Tax=Microbacterium sp. NPDC089695 TaxID=3364198 RepID=UPI003808EFB4